MNTGNPKHKGGTLFKPKPGTGRTGPTGTNLTKSKVPRRSVTLKQGVIDPGTIKSSQPAQLVSATGQAALSAAAPKAARPRGNRQHPPGGKVKAKAGY